MQLLWLLLEWLLLRVASPVAVHPTTATVEIISCQMIVKVSLIHAVN